MPKNDISEWPADGLEHLNQCPICGSSERQSLYQGLTDNTFYCAPGSWQLWRCQSCNSAYLDPRPSKDSIHMAYESYYTHTSTPAEQPGKLSGIKLFFQILTNGYLNARYGTALSPASKLLWPLLGLLFPQRRRYWDSQYRFIPKVAPGKQLLDVGFGSGDFMELAASIGWEVSGVDFDPVAVTNAKKRGFRVFEGGIEVLKEMHGTFDAITMSHLIEHVHDPVATLQIAFDLLKPGGLLFLETPNIDSMGLKLYGPCWRGLETPRHLTFFTWESINGTFRSLGYSGVRNIYKPEVSKNLFRLSKEIQMGPQGGHGKISLTARERACGLLARIRRHSSEFITVTARKPE